MQVELIPGPRSLTYAAQCDGRKARLYVRGHSYDVTDELGAELIRSGRFQPARTATVDPKGVAQKARAEGLINALAGMGDEAMSRFEALLGVALAAPPEPVAALAPPDVEAPSQATADALDDIAPDESDDDESGMDPLPGQSQIPKSWPALLSFASEKGVQTAGRTRVQIIGDLAIKGIE